MINIVRTQSHYQSDRFSLKSEGEDWMIGLDEVAGSVDLNYLEGALKPTFEVNEIDESYVRIILRTHHSTYSTPDIEISNGKVIISGVRTSDGNDGSEHFKKIGINMLGYRRSFLLSDGDELLENEFKDGDLELIISRNSRNGGGKP